MPRKETIHAAKQIIRQHPEGIRYTPLRDRLKEMFPSVPRNTIHSNIWNLDQICPSEIAKPVKGLFKWIGEGESAHATNDISPPRIQENEFYGPFADYLVGQLGDCTKAVSIGGNMFREKWGTPDVMGTLESRQSDIIKFPTQIVSAEIKIDTTGEHLITAFGQAYAYKLFSHKSYLVIPKSSGEEDLDRMESLCFLHGIGLVLFNRGDTANPCFEIRHRAVPREPDPFYVNKYAKILEEKCILFH